MDGDRLKESSVAVVGCGGLGCSAAQFLAAAGVGHLYFIDSDRVEESNLYRQVLYSVHDIGRLKCEVAAEKLSLQYPNIKVHSRSLALTADNAVEVLRPCNIVIDATDNIAARYAICDGCVSLSVPWIYGSISHHQAQLSVFAPHRLSYRKLFPPGTPTKPLVSCSSEGVLGPLPGIVGSIQALEAIKILTGIRSALIGKLMVIDTFTWNSRLYTLDDPDVFLLDVREIEEHLRGNLGGICIPLAQFPEAVKSLPVDREIIVYCQTGLRSKAAVQIASSLGLHNVRSYSGPVD